MEYDQLPAIILTFFLSSFSRFMILYYLCGCIIESYDKEKSLE